MYAREGGLPAFPPSSANRAGRTGASGGAGAVRAKDFPTLQAGDRVRGLALPWKQPPGAERECSIWRCVNFVRDCSKYMIINNEIGISELKYWVTQCLLCQLRVQVQHRLVHPTRPTGRKGDRPPAAGAACLRIERGREPRMGLAQNDRQRAARATARPQRAQLACASSEDASPGWGLRKPTTQGWRRSAR